MSAQDGGLPHPRPPAHDDASCSPASTDGSRPGRRLRPADLLARQPSNVIGVDDAARVLECSQIERQLRFQHLVRHYLSQILHGCKSAYCDTPTCLSANRRNPPRPLRPPTQLTARALAHYLASQDNPYRGLCPHELKLHPASFEINGTIDSGIDASSNGVDREYRVYPSIWKWVEHPFGAHGMAEGESSRPRHRERVMEVVSNCRQTKKDTKSLTQNLYDSATMIYSYTKQIPTPASVLSLLRASYDAHPQNTKTSSSSPPQLAQTAALASVPDAGPKPHANGQPVTPHVNSMARVVRQHSQQHPLASGAQYARPNSPELLSNGQQLHKIPFHHSSCPAQSNTPKSSSTPAVDGTSESPMPPTMKKGKKTSFVGKEGVPTLGPAKTLDTVLDEMKRPTRQSHPPGTPLPAVVTLSCDALDELKRNVYYHRKDQPADFNYVVDYEKNRHFRPTKPFVNRSLFYTLSNSNTLLRSFHDNTQSFRDSPLSHLDSARLTHSFQDWSQRNGALIFDSLWIAVEALFTPPPELDAQKSPRLKPTRKGASTDSSSEQSCNDRKSAESVTRYLSTREAAHIVLVCIHALTSLVPVGWTHTWAQIRRFRSWGVIIPNAAPSTNAFAHPYMDIIDELEYEPAVRLADRLLRGIGARTCFEHILAVLNEQDVHGDNTQQAFVNETLVDLVTQHLEVVERVALASKREMKSTHDTSEDPGWTVTATFLEWLRTIIIKKWDSKPEINKWSSVGTAIMLLNKLHEKHSSLNLRPSMFEMPFFNKRLDVAGEPLTFLSWQEQPNTLHVFQYPNLFPAQYLVAYFRTINFTSMMAQYDHTTRIHQMQRSLEMFLSEPYWSVIRYRMKVTLSEYLLLDVSRKETLTDTLDQLWGLEKRMLLKPLKVKMGHDEGEVGADHGGVTYEFFRVVLSEAFDPDNGMFRIDPQSRMTWFQPRTLEPEWKLEMIGIVFSLALYNGITLPVTFPLAFYHFLLPLDSTFRNREVKPQTLDFIKDGWPGLAKAFGDLLSWSDGDVGEVMMREYAFSYDMFGHGVDHNMKYFFDHSALERSMSSDSPQEEASMVTNDNREQFVRDYIRFLTYESVAPQLHAFLKGFLACINPKSLHFFTPSTLRNLIEGTQHISIPDLRRCTKYEDGYSPASSTIRDFWAIAEGFSQEDCRHLLEFVTASDRVPVTGYESITFHIAKAGGQRTSLPTSSTCFGKLYLPDYGNKDVLRRELQLAIRNSKGFGVV